MCKIHTMKKYILKGVMVWLGGILSLVSMAQNGQQPAARGIQLEGYPYPYPVHYISLTIQGQQLKMAYMDVTPAQPNGHTVMLLHGKNFSGAYWGQTAKRLSDAGYRVIIPDQLGFGKSSKPVTLQYTFQLLAQNTRAILDTLQINKIDLLGHSMGGMIATRFALMYPERIEKFILEDPIGLEDWKLKIPYQSVDKNYEGELKQTYESLKKYELESYYDGKWKPEYDEWLNIPASWLSSPDYPRVAWNAALTSDMIFTQPVCYEFQNITAPTLLIIGQKDRTIIAKNQASKEAKETMGNYPVLGRLTQQKIKGSKLVEINNVGHLPHIEAFEKFITPLLDFLKTE